ncbi:hypothetical protein A0H76_2191 [Hepatospora eriocheir]|uniref:Uncharacterized protein n=1 Tax=Hepatospora eriocheir TaxID=1081669 RepID=A0A1X0QLE0_9MICR|nr:hypothetical protein A0H76_2191 [Hepatospora eriocheir]
MLFIKIVYLNCQSLLMGSSLDNAVENELRDSKLKNTNPPNKIVAGSLKTTKSNVGSLIKSELTGVSSDIQDNINNMIRNSKVDRSKFRDLFLIKKHVVNNGEKTIVSFDVQERIIPKETGMLSIINDDSFIKIFLICVMLLLLALVFATSLKVYQSIIKINKDKKLLEEEI